MQKRVPHVSRAARMAGYRKLIAFLATITGGCLLKAFGQFDEAIGTFLGGTLLVYVGGNVREHAHNAKKVALPAEDPVEEANESTSAIEPLDRAAVDGNALASMLQELITRAAKGPKQ